MSNTTEKPKPRSHKRAAADHPLPVVPPEPAAPAAPLPPMIHVSESDERVLALFKFRVHGTLESASEALSIDVLSIRHAIGRLQNVGLLDLSGGNKD